MAATHDEAARLGLDVVRLLTWDIEKGMPRRLAEDENPERLLYGLDELEVSTKALPNDGSDVPADIFTCPNTGLPLRPLYLHLASGRVLRAVPISWNEGVDYYAYRDLVESGK